ncbi:g1849 [Coccomyxa elongata]
MLAMLNHGKAEAATNPEGPPKGKFSALPFRETPEEAAQAFEQYHNQNFFLMRPEAGLKKVKESFLPFWVTTASVQVVLRGARVGFDAWVSVYNPQTRRYEQQLRTTWHQVSMHQTWQRSYSATEEGMQVYASYKYPRSEVQQLRPGRVVTQATEFTPRMLTSAATGETRRVGPFDMKPNIALRFVTDWMRQQETEAAEGLVRTAFNADRVGSVNMDFTVVSMRSSPVYVPAYIFRSQHFGTKMRTFVSGVNAKQVAGQRAYDEGKVAVLAGLAAGVGMGMLQGLAALAVASNWIWGVALPMTIAGIATHYLTWMRARWAAFWQQNEQRRDAEGNTTGAWDAEWVHMYTQYEEQRRRMDERENAQFFGGGYSGQGSARDPLGYYQLMGLEPGCSKQEIQAAFRGLAMQWHPDKVDEKDKAAASRRFQQLNEAYSVLRDPVKRRQYDSR